MPDHTHLNLHDQLITVIDMKLCAQNQLCNFFTFCNLKVLIASLGMPDPTHVKLHHEFYSFNRYVTACKQSTSNSFGDIKA